MSKLTSVDWRRADNEVESAQILLAESGSSLESPEVFPITLPEVAGFEGLAFAIPKILDQWGGRLREISLDSAFNTNGSRFEIFSLMGEVGGSGMPLGFLLVRSHGDGEAGGKQTLIQAFLTAIRDKWNLNISFALTDKDWAEINAFHLAFPDTKIQLCFWHCLRAVKKRLAILRRTPAFYDANEAHTEFAFVDPTFVPQSQREPVSI